MAGRPRLSANKRMLAGLTSRYVPCEVADAGRYVSWEIKLNWQVFKVFENGSEAELLKDFLQKNGVPVKIDHGILESGVDGVYLYVPEELVHRAKWFAADSAFTDEELDYLATGKLRNGMEE